MPAPPHQGRTALYRFYDADGQLLYVGISHDPETRWRDGHKLSSVTRRDVARREEEWFDTRTEAAAAEVAAIKREKPRDNIAHNCETVTFDGSEWPNLADGKRDRAPRLAELIKGEIREGRWKPRQFIPSHEALAEATGIGLFAAKAATTLLYRQGVLDRRKGPGLGLYVAEDQ